MAEKDTIMKDLLKDKKLFLEFIQAFLKFDFVHEISEDNLVLLNSDFETNQKTKLESDVLYKVIYQDKEIYVFVLIEHQSSVDYNMAFRMLEYIFEIWRMYIKDNKNDAKHKNFKLPPVIPFVFYDGSGHWTAARKIEDRIYNYEVFEQYIPKFEYGLIELRNEEYDYLSGLQNAIGAILYADKGLREEPTDERILKIAEIIKTSIPEDQKAIVGKYIKSMFEILKKKEIITDDDMKAIKEATEVENMATALEVAIKKRSKWERQAGKLEGRLEGKLEGLEEGKRAGLLDGIYEGIQDLIEIKFQIESLGYMEKIRKINDLAKLKELKDVIKKAKSIDEIDKYL